MPDHPPLDITGTPNLGLIDEPQVKDPGYSIPPSNYTDPSDIIIGMLGGPGPRPKSPGTRPIRTPATVLKKTKPRVFPVNFTGQGAVLPVPYGNTMVPAKLGCVIDDGNDVLVLLVWGKGEIGGVNKVYNGADDVTAHCTNYVGTQVQAADPDLVAAIAGYTDTLLGIAYSVVRMTRAAFDRFGKFVGDLNGRIIHDPRVPSNGYSTNPALMFRDAAILAGLTPDDVSIKATADDCDALVPATSDKRRECGIYFDQPASVDEVLATLAEYAGAFYVREAGVVKLISDRPAGITASFTDGTNKTITATTLSVATADNSFNDSGNGFLTAGFKVGDTIHTSGFSNGGNNSKWVISTVVAGKIVLTDGTGLVVEAAGASATVETKKLAILDGSLVIKKRSHKALPNRSVVEYTDTGTVPWRKHTAATAYPVGEELRTTRFYMPGIQNFKMATRQVNERQNFFDLTDLYISFTAFDDSLELEKGDLFDVDSFEGLTNKAFRCSSVEGAGDVGLWRIEGGEYQPSAYSDADPSLPVLPDTNIPSPGDFPTPATPVLVEELYVEEGGRTLSRIRATWDGTGFRWATGYKVEWKVGSTVIFDTQVAHIGIGTANHFSVTPPIKQDELITCNIKIVNVLGNISTSTGTANITALGKALLPTPPKAGSMTGFEAGQFVNLTWARPDPVDIDHIGYVLKRLDQTNYDAAADDAARWSHASAVSVSTKVDAEGVLLAAQPVGAWYYMAKSLDSLLQESTLFESKLINVTADQAGQISANTLAHDVALITNMHVYEVHGVAVYLTSSAGDSWIDLFGVAGSNWDLNYSAGEPWNKFENAVSSMETLEWDLAADKQGNFVWVLNAVVHQGTISYTTRYAKAADYPTFTDAAGQSINAEARYAKAKIAMTGALGDAMTLKMPTSWTFQGVVLEDLQTISVPVSPQPKAVVWGQGFSQAPQVTLTLIGSAPRIIAADAVTKTGCNLFAWDDAAAAAAATIDVQAKGS